MKGHLGKQHSSVTLELRCRLRIRSSRTEQYAPVRVLAGTLHLALPEQAPTSDSSDGFPEE